MSSRESEPRLKLRHFVLSGAVAAAILYAKMKYDEHNLGITEGSVFRKEHVAQDRIDLLPGVPLPFTQAKVPEHWQVYIAQCPKRVLPEWGKIDKDCKTNSFKVPQDLYDALPIGAHADFRRNAGDK